MPADGEGADGAMHTLALCQIFQVRAMEEKVGMHLSHVSLLDNDDVREHHAPASAPSANAVASDVSRQVVPHVSGASAGDQ
ncbi:hypothetical protein CYMTET_5643 [Cymbomonas tetramitiformis]|uniref:Uncharacterized protein n=1 Tax=Cymbomonas tetramitiformis TaxID=36881 RepID=A0AAE0LJ72_9CHLO|nr:hypothetical protein CYMTET_5643 [Cymbomonas tetramitiformis]